MLSTLSETFWILALGAFRPGDVVGVTIVVAALALLWIGHAMWDSRHRDPHDRATIRARERRGF